uniref:Evasin n=1 Tax=Amblyomma triste TaxID=251400 RepID=A0A023G8Z2_AMBTT
MLALWLLVFGCVFGDAISSGGNSRVPGSMPANAAIPGCGEAETTTAPPADNPKHYAVVTDKYGCEVKVIGSWFTKDEDAGKAFLRSQRRRSSERVQLPVACKKSCQGTMQSLPEGFPCRLVVGDPKGRRNHIYGGCLTGVCEHGRCESWNKTVSCYLPHNSTHPRTTISPHAE